MLGRVRDRKMDTGHAASIFYSLRFAGDHEARRTVRVDNDLDIVPRDLPAPSGLQGLEECLFCGKPRGVGLSRGGSL